MIVVTLLIGLACGPTARNGEVCAEPFLQQQTLVNPTNEQVEDQRVACHLARQAAWEQIEKRGKTAGVVLYCDTRYIQN